MNFKSLKELCYEHDELLKKTKIIERNMEKQHWLHLVTANGEEISLWEEEKKLLKDYYEKRGLEIEKTILEILKK